MRLAIVCYPTFGGSGVVASELAMQLADRGHEVHVVSNEIPFRLDRWRQNLVLHTVSVGDYPLFRYPPYTLNLTNKLIEVVKEHGVELIHSHYAIPHAHAAWMAREVLRAEGIDIRLVCTLHGTDITLVGRDPGFHALTRFAIEHQDVITTPSAWLADQTTEHFGIARERILPIANFVDLDRFTPRRDCEARRCLAPKGTAIITHASNYRPVKRVEEVIGAFAVMRKRQAAVLLLVGDGPELAKAENLARELGVRDDIRLLGQQERIEEILQASDLFLLPSRAESFGLAALEAMACGCPVLGYRAGGLPEVVEHNVSGILCEEGAAACLGSVAAELLADRPRYDAMRVAARTRAERFAEKPIITEYEDMLKGALALKRRANA
jgi:L-malate glycosyltransferase